MKKIRLGLVAMAILGSSLSAGSLFFDRGIDSDFDRFNRYANRVFHQHLAESSFSHYPKLNMIEEKDRYILKFELAGMKKSDIKLSLESNNLLVLSGEKRAENREQNGTYYKEEISYGKFQRAISLPKDANSDKMETKYKDGLLTVTIPKQEVTKEKSKVITIN